MIKHLDPGAIFRWVAALGLSTAAVKSFTPYQPPTARQVDDSQLRMALQNENTMSTQTEKQKQ